VVGKGGEEKAKELLGKAGCQKISEMKITILM
jgi:hypothetical protein